MNARTEVAHLASPALAVPVTLSDGKTFEASAGTTLLEAAARAGLTLANSCRTGRCGACRTKVQAGRTSHCQGEDTLSDAERREGWTHTCTDAAVDGPLRLAATDLAEFAGLRLLTLPARVHAIRPLAQDVVALTLRLPSRHGLRWIAGQHLDLIAPGGLRRAYSFAGAEPIAGADGTTNPDHVELLIRRVAGGAMSDFVFDRLKPGDLLRIQGPRGTFALGDVAGLDLLWLATGTGIAPFLAMLQDLARRPSAAWPRRITLVWGNRLPQDFHDLPASALRTLPLTLLPVCSRADEAWQGARGHVQQVALARAQAEGRPLPDRIHACGSPAMVDAARLLFAQQGFDPIHFHADAFVVGTGTP